MQGRAAELERAEVRVVLAPEALGGDDRAAGVGGVVVALVGRIGSGVAVEAVDGIAHPELRLDGDVVVDDDLGLQPHEQAVELGVLGAAARDVVAAGLEARVVVAAVVVAIEVVVEDPVELGSELAAPVELQAPSAGSAQAGNAGEQEEGGGCDKTHVFSPS
jgi:hypothetical protein